MKIIDLIHYISENMPVYPETGPKFARQFYEVNGFKEMLITMINTPHAYGCSAHYLRTELHLTNFKSPSLLARHGCIVVAGGQRFHALYRQAKESVLTRPNLSFSHRWPCAWNRKYFEYPH